uniref:Glutamine amidotransferase class-I domain protein n=1 Tax=uncultured bacterium Contig2 TaxID=1393529 RepID=W0FN17_9BACT|nr:glutamine amidotransferase class-I domain protein [uncultured bacterium Contig2]
MLRIAVPTNRPQAVVNYLDALARTEGRGETGRSFSPDEYDGLLLPGGWDVNPSRYGRERIPQETVDDELDAIQFEALARFLEAGKPVLGICRGHQLLNIAFGGTLIQHLPCAQNHMSLPTTEDNIHPVHILQDSFAYRIYGAECMVNSSHHQGIGAPGKGLRIVMRSEDGVIEGIEHESLPVWGVQWHPERMCFRHQRNDTADGSMIFRFFLEQCRKSGNGRD